MSEIPFVYGEFYDFPRMLRFAFGGQWYFLRSYFDEEQDEYEPNFVVYRLSHFTEADLSAGMEFWVNLPGATELGRIALVDVGFDISRRQTISAQAFAQWLCGKP